MKVKELEVLPQTMVGDGKSPNVFFVSVAGRGVVLISRDFDIAYDYWRFLPRNIETSLEDRKTGVVCSTEPIEDGSTRFVTRDDSRMVR